MGVVMLGVLGVLSTLLNEYRSVPQGVYQLYATNKQHKHTQFICF
jgi:hypothetical protein